MNIYEFMSESPWLAFFIALFIVIPLVKITFIYCISQPLRHLSIRKHGWPPSHCDADGDFKPISECDEDKQEQNDTQ